MKRSWFRGLALGMADQHHQASINDDDHVSPFKAIKVDSLSLLHVMFGSSDGEDQPSHRPIAEAILGSLDVESLGSLAMTCHDAKRSVERWIQRHKDASLPILLPCLIE